MVVAAEEAELDDEIGAAAEGGIGARRTVEAVVRVGAGFPVVGVVDGAGIPRTGRRVEGETGVAARGVGLVGSLHC